MRFSMSNVIDFDNDLFLEQMEKDFFEDHAKEWRKVKSEIERLSDLERHYRNKLIDAVNGDEREESGIKVSRQFRSGSINYAKIPIVKDFITTQVDAGRLNLDDYKPAGTYFWKITPSTKG